MAKEGRKKKKVTQAVIEREMRQLIRLQTIMDVVYAIIIWRLFMILPRPEVDEWAGGSMVIDVLVTYADNFLVLLVGLVLVLVYWMQNNKLFGKLSRTNGVHASISLLQLVFLLMYLYFVGLDIRFEGDRSVLFLQSVGLARAGFVAVAGWRYASKDRRLLTDTITDEEIGELHIAILPEPITALLTIPFVWLGHGWWTLAWLLAIPIGWLLKKRHTARIEN
ncbi:MAG: TMEM175 family protein [Bacteroidota bacterium]